MTRMVPPMVALELPTRSVPVIGNDGLTDAERERHAAAYEAKASRALSAAERKALTEWLRQRADR